MESSQPPQFLEALLQRFSIFSLRCMAEVGFDLGGRKGPLLQLGMHQSKVAALNPIVRQDHDQALHHTFQSRPIFLRPVDILEVAQQLR